MEKRIEIERNEEFRKIYTVEKIAKYSSELNKHELRKEDFYCEYLTIVKKTIEMIRAIGVNDPMTASAIYQHLLWNGFFSKHGTLKYNNHGNVTELAGAGVDVVLGKTNAISNADMLTDVLCLMGNDAYLIGSDVKNPIKVSLEYKPDIKQRVSHVHLMEKRECEEVSNSALTMFQMDDAYYLSDPTGLGFLNFTDILQGQYVGSEQKVSLDERLTLLVNDVDPEKFYKVFNQTFASVGIAPITVEEVQYVYGEAERVLRTHSGTLSDFQNEIAPNIEEVERLIRSR